MSLAIILWIGGCGKTPQELKAEREQVAIEGKGEVIVGVVWTSSDGDFVKGVELATEEVNFEGGFNGRNVKLDKRVVVESSVSSAEDQQSLRDARDIARSLSEQTNLIAVIGHRATSFAIPASIVYQEHGVLFFPPAATGLMFTRHNFAYPFRIISDNREMANYLAMHCRQMGYRSMAIFNNRSIYAEELANSFVEGAVMNKIEVAHRRSFFDSRTDFSQLIAELKKKGHVDAIFLAAGATDGARFIKQSRKMGIDIPFVGGEALGTQKFVESVGETGEGLIIPTVFNETAENILPFVKKFREKHKQNPDHLAAAGYDTMRLLAHAIRENESAVPIRIATYLRYMPSWQGVSGNFEFDESGELKDKKLYLKILCQGQFHTLPTETHKLVNMETDSLQSEQARRCLELFSGLIFLDKDQDGIADKKDICPNSVQEDLVKGVYPTGDRMGCPFDADNDGIPDYRDQCPNTTKLEKEAIDEKGCAQDLDKDGIIDSEDSCLETPLGAVVDNRGCPVVAETPEIFTLQGDSFAKGTTQLQSSVEPVLNRLLERLTKISAYIKGIEITGYTDSKGNKLKNKELSKDRATKVAEYLISHGLSADKITVSGQGDEQPVDSNETEEGRAKNRRVEIKITLLQQKVELASPPANSQ